MLIENPDAFKTWLTSVLEPLCDADPEALAKYVFALVKKDKAVDALREGMLEQLDVFLQSETKPFVELLFKTLETQDYLIIPNANPPNPNPPLSLAKKDVPEPLIVKDIKPIIPVSTLPNLSESINGNVQKAKTNVEETPPSTVNSTTGSGKRDHRKSDSEKEDRRRRPRSRSRSWERSAKRSRSPRSPRRGRPWRNKSPPIRGRHRRSRSGSGGRAPRSRSRSPPRHSHRAGSSRYRNRSPPPARSPSRSRSRDKKDSGAATPTQDSNHGDTDMRLTSTAQSIQSVVSAAQTGTPAIGEAFKRRCRDFDEKGYCMRGEMCPYDHGVDPVVLEDTALSRVLTFGPGGAPLETPPAPPGLLHGPTTPMLHHHTNEYNPSAPGMWHQRAAFRPRGALPPLGPRPGLPGGPFIPLPSMQRELISVPVTDNVSGFKRRAANDFTSEQILQQPPNKRKQSGFDFNRLGPRAAAPKHPANCSLELKKVPRGLNNITHLNNHFSRFGKIVNIQVQFEGDPEAALVTFSSHAEANAAYRSTEAVLNNRFIKVFWHSHSISATAENTPPAQGPPVAPASMRPPVKDRLGQPPHSSNKVFNLVQPRAAEPAGDDARAPNEGSPISEGTAIQQGPKSMYIPSAAVKDSRALANAAIVKAQEILAAKEQLKKKQQEKRKEKLKDLRKRKQELLEKQLAQQKLLIEKLEKTNPTGPQRELLMSTIKTVQESIESIRRDMLTASVPRPTGPTLIARKSKEDAQREMLDAELDLITRQQEGGDTSELQRRLQELRAQAMSLTRGGAVRRGPPLARHHRVHQMRLSKNNLLHHVVDHRPSRLLVSGYEADEADSVLAHFAQYGEISEYVTDSSTPSIVLKYRTRKEAEVAMLKGRNFQDRTLSVTWSVGASPRGAAPRSYVALNAGATPVTPAVETADTAPESISEGQPDGKEADDAPGDTVEAQAVEQSESEAVGSNEDQLLEGDDENILGAEFSEEVLLQDDEEDEEGEEDRSWRR